MKTDKNAFEVGQAAGNRGLCPVGTRSTKQPTVGDRCMKYLIISATASLVISGCAAPSQMSADAEVKRLCAIDGGIKVYESVSLPADKFDKWGSVHVPPKNNASDASEFYFEREQTFLVIGDPHITRTVHKIIRRSDGKVLGASTRYGRGGGDIPGPQHPSSFMCPEISKDTLSLELSIFVKGVAK